MKKKFEEKIFSLMKENPKIVLLTADNDFADYDAFLREFPNRCYDFGIAECNAVGSAAGLAKEGFIPVVYGVGAFSAYRAFEFLRCNICIQNLKVVCVGFGAGAKMNNFGATHHSTEDISVLRVLPNLSLFSPASVNEVAPILDSAVAYNGPVYIRLGKGYETEIYDQEPEFQPGKSMLYREGSDLTFFVTGNIISEVIQAADKLEKEVISAEIINVSSLKPVDADAVIKSAKKTGVVVTVEEHQISGGLGSIVAEILAGKGEFVCDRIGLNDEFVEEYGWHKDILDTYRLNSDAIYERVKKLVLKGELK